MNFAKQQNLLAKRREAQQIKIEKSAAVDKYYDKWGRITSRFEQWTAPEYYEQADAQFRENQKTKQKTELIELKREKLRELLKQENDQYDAELKQLKTPKSKQIAPELLQNIHDHFKRTEEEKRRLELESKLYKTWRNTCGAESISIESKSDNETLAKMNWLDKQVAAQIERDRQQKLAEERALRMQEEARKHNELLLQHRIQRDEEIKEIKSFQDTHVKELKEKDLKSQELRSDESKLRQRLEDLNNELSLLDDHFTKRQQRKISNLYNTSRIKMYLRKRCEQIRQEIDEDIEMLNRISLDYSNDHLQTVRDKFLSQQKQQLYKLTEIEGMFESEAKHSAQTEEQFWADEAQLRQKLLKQIIFGQIRNCEKCIQINFQQQQELVEIKETHMDAIENSNSRYKELMQQQKDETKDKLNTVLGNGNSDRNKTAQNLEFVPSKFGRKKVAWL